MIVVCCSNPSHRPDGENLPIGDHVVGIVRRLLHSATPAMSTKKALKAVKGQLEEGNYEAALYQAGECTFWDALLGADL